MGKRKIYTDENGKTYQIINGEKNYVEIMPLIDPLFENIEKDYKFIKMAKKDLISQIIDSLLNNNDK